MRHGFLAAVRLHQFDEGVVFPHEQTLSGPKEDRYQLMTATGMSLSPVFLLYDLPGDEVTGAWRTDPAPAARATVTDEDGNVTKLWPTSDPALLETVGQRSGGVLVSSSPTAITGTRRPCAISDHAEREQASGRRRGAAPAYDYVLAYFSNMADPGLAIYGTHRLLAGLDPRAVAALPRLARGDVRRRAAGSARPR